MDRHDDAYIRFSQFCESAYERFIRCIFAPLMRPYSRKKKKKLDVLLVHFIISPYLTNYWLLGERIFFFFETGSRIKQFRNR